MKLPLPKTRKPVFIQFPQEPERLRGKFPMPKVARRFNREVDRDYPADRIKLVKAGDRVVVVRSTPLAVENKIVKLERFASKGCYYYHVWFKTPEGKLLERSAVLRINGRYYLPDFKYLRLSIERTAGEPEVIIDSFQKPSKKQ